MEKVNIALSAAEDNAAAIRELNKKLIKRTTCRTIFGKPGAGFISFGNVTSDGTLGVVIVFNTSGTAKLTFCGEDIAISITPIVAVLPAGTGEMRIARTASYSCALLIGGEQ